MTIFIFANAEKARKSEEQFLLVMNRRTTKIEKMENGYEDPRGFRKLTIVLTQLLLC